MTTTQDRFTTRCVCGILSRTGLCEHLSNESPVPRAGEGERWRVERRDTRSVIIDREGNAMAFACGNNGNEREQRATQIATEHNQHATLVAQRNRLLVLLRATMKIVADRMSGGRMITTCEEAAAVWDECNAVVIAIEQEGKS